MLMMGLRQGIATTLSLLFFSAVLSHAFVLPSWGLNGHLRIPTRCGKGKVATRMMLLPPEAPQSFISTSTNLMVRAVVDRNTHVHQKGIGVAWCKGGFGCHN